MLRTRVIPTICYSGGIAYKPISFGERRTIGPLLQMARVYQRREVDELIILDIDATKERREPDYESVEEIAAELFSPLCVGGGIATLDHINRLLRCGADKVAIKSHATPRFIQEASEKFGAQAIVLAIDFPFGDPAMVYAIYAHQLQGCGVGEILLTSMANDGNMNGYDLKLIHKVSRAVSIPVIANGGCGGYLDMLNAIRAGAHAVAASSIFQFTEATPRGACEYLAEHGVPVRLAA